MAWKKHLVTVWRPWRHPSGLRKLLTGALKPLGLLELLLLAGLFALLLGFFKVLLEQLEGNAALLCGGLDGFRKLRQNYQIKTIYFILKNFDQLQIPCFINLHIYNAKLNFVGKCNYKHILYAQEVVTRPKILNRIFYPNEFMWPKIILPCKRILFNHKV